MDDKLKKFEDLKIKAEKELVDRMKAELADLLKEQPELNTTFHITRFLHARDNNYEKAKSMFQKFLLFRKQKNITRIGAMDMNSEKMKLFKDYYTAGHYGVDNEGRLIIIERVGFYDYKAMATDYTREELEDFFLQLQERMLFIEFPILSELAQKRIARNIVILDLKNLHLPKLFHAKFRLFMEVAISSIKDYYPETLDKSIFINAPFGAPATWKIIKLMLDPKTAAKFEMFSDNGQKYFSKLLNFDNLPMEIGGKNIVSLQYGYGPYIDEIKKSYQRKSVFLSDREIEYKWFYTEEERKALEKETQSTLALTQDKVHLEHNYSTEFSQSITNRSKMNKSQKVSISRVRVNSYFEKGHSFR